ncbi:MAG: hypothetical protein A2711_12475 [Burkholderiales bacterium RIFCSPHIGHO2_01_FULL_63_240]|nr:MAG: hypothetical protein A2711_12475 [Burkholderiales bacterium RIFCSPHIGHO2_01_FULL_63_240]
MAPAPSGVPSPCRSLCRLDEADLCTGCGRSRDDIRRWKTMADDERLACLARAARQRQAWDSLAAPRLGADPA